METSGSSIGWAPSAVPSAVLRFPDGPLSLRAGMTLGPYRIVRPLGRGGMGEVYLAVIGHSDARVALKVIRPEFTADRGLIARFQREARLTARLRHPNIVQRLDAGFDDGIPWLAMEYIEGPRGEPMDLFELFAERQQRRHAFSEDEAIAVGMQICDALAYAHGFRDPEIPSGIVHRDLKPANILVGADTRLYVADFGLARLIGRDFEKSVVGRSVYAAQSIGDLATDAGWMAGSGTDRVGTFDYMSPEQRDGREADARSDVYALGAILYELLTGRKVAGVPKRPTKVRPDLRPMWDEIVYERCLAADPQDRYSLAGELRDAILSPVSAGAGVSMPAVKKRAPTKSRGATGSKKPSHGPGQSAKGGKAQRRTEAAPSIPPSRSARAPALPSDPVSSRRRRSNEKAAASGRVRRSVAKVLEHYNRLPSGTPARDIVTKLLLWHLSPAAGTGKTEPNSLRLRIPNHDGVLVPFLWLHDEKRLHVEPNIRTFCIDGRFGMAPKAMDSVFTKLGKLRTAEPTGGGGVNLLVARFSPFDVEAFLRIVKLVLRAAEHPG